MDRINPKEIRSWLDRLGPNGNRVAMMVRYLTLLVWASLASVCSGQGVETIAGTGVKGFSGDGGPASKAQLNNPFAVARGPDGYLYLCDVDNHRIRRISPDGIIETYAGSGTKGYSGDGGPATAAALNQPYELAWDSEGNLFFVEIGNHVVRKVDKARGTIQTVAGTGKSGFSGDGGPALKAQLNQPHSLCMTPQGDLLVCDILNHRIRKVDLRSGIITTFAGNGQKKTDPDGTPFAAAALHGPRAMAVGGDGTFWLALREGNAVLKLDPKTGTLERVAGTGKSGFSGNGGPALKATLAGPKGIALGGDGDVYLADTESHSIRKIDRKKNTVEVVVGDGKKGNGPNGPPLKCRLARPHGVWLDRDGGIYIGDSENHQVRVLKAGP